MNVETTQKINQSQLQSTTKTIQSQQNGDVKFSDELKTLQGKEEPKEANNKDSNKNERTEEVEKNKTSKDKTSEDKTQKENSKAETEDAIDGLQNAVEEMNKFNRIDENETDELKNLGILDDKNNRNNEANGLIDNNMNIQEQVDRLKPELNSGMNFNSDGKPFSEFVKNNNGQVLKASSKDLAEENAILSTMEENIAIANKNIALNDNTKTIANEKGIKKVDKNTNITIDTIVKFDSVIVSKEDADFFINLVENGGMNIHDSERAETSSKVSKTLADLLAKSMNENKPIRINFDNDISVIIRISRDGKLSADFLPSSQVAEAYLKENLPLLKQRFDDNNIEYGELNQRKQKQEEQNQNRKKGSKNE